MLSTINIICSLLSLTLLIDLFTKKRIYSITNTKFYKWLPAIACNILYIICITLTLYSFFTRSNIIIGILAAISSVYTSLYCYILIINIKKGNKHYA